jgi:hypothetical protein
MSRLLCSWIDLVKSGPEGEIDVPEGLAKTRAAVETVIGLDGNRDRKREREAVEKGAVVEGEEKGKEEERGPVEREKKAWRITLKGAEGEGKARRKVSFRLLSQVSISLVLEKVADSCVCRPHRRKEDA